MFLCKNMFINVAKQLEQQFGRSYSYRNVRRMMQFANEFPDIRIVTPLVTQLSWTHLIELFPLKTMEYKLFYTNKIATEKWSVRQTKRLIERKAFDSTNVQPSTKAPLLRNPCCA